MLTGRTLRSLFSIAVIVSGLCVVLPCIQTATADEAVYIWRDDQGVEHMSNTPPPSTVKDSGTTMSVPKAVLRNVAQQSSSSGSTKTEQGGAAASGEPPVKEGNSAEGESGAATPPDKQGEATGKDSEEEVPRSRAERARDWREQQSSAIRARTQGTSPPPPPRASANRGPRANPAQPPEEKSDTKAASPASSSSIWDL